MTRDVQISGIPEIIEDVRAGRMVILMDDEDRENEGDLIMAASRVTPDAVNFMARYGRGLICLTLTGERCDALNLPLMVVDNNDKNATNFTVSIEAARGVTTGISAADRATTILAAVAPDARPEDIVMPGHIFPLRAQPGGVLARAGHTEAGCDLARLAGCEPAAVIVEILNEDGTMARQPELRVFAAEHGLKLGTIADLIRYRAEHEKPIELVVEAPFNTRYGEFRLAVYHDTAFDETHLALIRGTVDDGEPTLVRVQSVGALRDLLGGDGNGGWSIDSALQRIAREDRGVLVLLNRGMDGEHLVREVRQLKMHRLGVQLSPGASSTELRQYGIGAQILADQGVRKLRVMGKPRRMHGLSGFDMELLEFVPWLGSGNDTE
ncbi:MAG: bifunctional 3,4-dihydroxy-2-butanone-4-phosphate synthase/GTP cyclohydrolase II [Pseudomonadota bacterium]|nr:bifunctional 3,4-dihydroxy-2-butanone-4-phosphate synthase/GTP cyclohydrolase II [Pseudomonadota bacterium]